jgi:elongation factor Ts
MADITALMVKNLRETTGAGMMDCKRALEETGGETQAAIDWLRTKGLAKAAKKADRVAAEGAIALALREEGPGMTGALIELNAETDFVARNQVFQSAARAIAKSALDFADDIDALRGSPAEGGQSVGEMVTALVATIGENIRLRRVEGVSVTPGAVGGYVHGAVAGAPDLGRIGVLVAVEGAGDQATLKELARNIALHAAATNPLSLSPDDLDPASVAKEKSILTEQAAESGKPPNVVEKMVEGRIRKWMEEVVLLKQAYVKNPDQTVEQLVADTAKAVGSPIKVIGFARMALGEGVDRASADFAAEVAAMTQAN